MTKTMTKTQTKCLKTPTYAIFLKSWWLTHSKYDDRYLIPAILFTPVTLVTLFRSYNQFYRAEFITVSWFFSAIKFVQFFLTSKITSWQPKRVLYIVWASFIICNIWGDLNVAEYGSRRSEQPQNVKFEPITRFNCKRKKWGKKISVNLKWTQMNLEELSQKDRNTKRLTGLPPPFPALGEI